MELKELLDKHSYNSYECNDDKTVWVISETQLDSLIKEYESNQIIDYTHTILDIPCGKIGLYKGKKYTAIENEDIDDECCKICSFYDIPCEKINCFSHKSIDNKEKYYKEVE